MRWLFCLTLGTAMWAQLFLITPQSHSQETTTSPGIVFLVEGIGGLDLMHVSGTIGLKWQAGLPHEIRQFFWSHGTGCFLKDLQDFRHLESKAQELGREILAIKRETPGRPVYLVAHSAGTGLAIRTAELLPPNTVDRIVLLASALSPRRDLRSALLASKGGIVSYYSPYDYLILHFGTRQFGTVDRFYEESAGYRGFEMPPSLSTKEKQLYRDRLLQIPWRSRMIWHGHWGNHTGSVMPGFLGGEVANWLRESTP